MPIAFTARALAALALPDDRASVSITDALTPGLQFVRRNSGGFFVYRYRLHGQQCAFPIGSYRRISIDAARRRAAELASLVASGIDPRSTLEQSSRCPTLDHFFQRRYLPYVQVDKRSWATDERYYRHHLQPVFGRLQMNRIGRQQVQAFVHGKRAAGSAPATVNRMLVLLRYCFNLAIEWEIPGISGNPAQRVRPLPENNRVERYLSPEQAVALDIALGDSRSPLLRLFVAFLLLTGARRGEALHARWSDIDANTRTWRIPLAKSGKPRHVTLSDPALQILARLRERQSQSDQPLYRDSEFVFSKPDTGRPYGSLYDAWNLARRRAGLPRLRMHDLRHSFASALVNHGVALYEVQKLLGHASIRTTERYAHLQQTRLRESAAVVGSVFKHLLRSAAQPAESSTASQIKISI